MRSLIHWTAPGTRHAGAVLMDCRNDDGYGCCCVVRSVSDRPTEVKLGVYIISIYSISEQTMVRLININGRLPTACASSGR